MTREERDKIVFGLLAKKTRRGKRPPRPRPQADTVIAPAKKVPAAAKAKGQSKKK